MTMAILQASNAAVRRQPRVPNVAKGDRMRTGNNGYRGGRITRKMSNV